MPECPRAECPPHNRLLDSEQWQYIVNERDKSLSRIMDKMDAVEAQRDELAKALRDALNVWTFSEYQHPTHSWHDREDWRERHRAALAKLEEVPRG